ncbi:hypothetical protein ACET3Z_008481 [Daucus carota]
MAGSVLVVLISVGVCSVVVFVLYAQLFNVLNVHNASGSQVKVSLQELFLPAILNNSASDYSLVDSTSVFFVLSLHDDTYEMGALYDDITINFYYVGKSITPIANYTWPGFYQEGDEHGSTTQLSDYVNTQGVSFAQVSRNLSEIVLRVDLATSVRFKYSWWESQTHAISVQGDVKVSSMTGKKVSANDIKLSGQDSGGHYKAFIVFSFCFTGVENSDGSNLNQSIIYFKLNLENDLTLMGIYYDNLNLTFSYYTTEGNIVPVGNYTIPAFRQGLQAETDRKDYVVTTRGITWQEISNNVSVLSLTPSVSSDVVFRVDLATAVRFRQFLTGIKSKRLQTMAWCKVEVDRVTGKKKSNKAIKLRHMIKRHLSGWIIFASITLLLTTLFSPCLGYLCLGGVSKLLVRVFVEQLFVPAILNNSVSDYSLINSPSVFFVLSLHDDTYDYMGVVYDNITIRFYYVAKIATTPIANYTWPGFYQKGDEHGSTIECSDYVYTRGISFAEASRNVSEIVLRVDVATAFRFRYWWQWESSTHELLRQGDVKVSTMTGKKIAATGIELSQHNSGGYYKPFIAFSIFFCVFLTVIWVGSLLHACSDANDELLLD